MAATSSPDRICIITHDETVRCGFCNLLADLEFHPDGEGKPYLPIGWAWNDGDSVAYCPECKPELYIVQAQNLEGRRVEGIAYGPATIEDCKAWVDCENDPFVTGYTVEPEHGGF